MSSTEPETPVARGRTAAWLTGVTVSSLVIGGIAGVIWSRIAPLPRYRILIDGGATMTEAGLAQIFGADAWYVVIGAVGGIIIGGAMWARFRKLGWIVPLGALAAAMVAGLTCWQVGVLLGPGRLEPRIAAANPGDYVPVALTLRSPVAIVVWAFAAVGVILIASALAPDDTEPRRERRRRMPAELPAPEGAAPDDLGEIVPEPQPIRE